ncbi:pseudouridine synthase [Firmicutes bacterium CAG:449]|nr:pseudouridine synthase [Firmicutes bacterium CAG:449]
MVKVKSVSEGGKYALTYYKVLETFENCTLLNVKIVTGRTHQIRVHLSYINHPVLGDSKYGNFSMNKIFLEKYHYQNQFLHAYKIEFKNIEGCLSYLSNKTFIANLPNKEESILKSIQEEKRI